MNIAALTHSSMKRSMGRFMRGPEHPEAEDNSETQSDIDMEAATADISSELFGQGDEEEKVEPIEGEGASLPTVMRPPRCRRRPLPKGNRGRG
jgi:hypothetical protein